MRSRWHGTCFSPASRQSARPAPALPLPKVEALLLPTLCGWANSFVRAVRPVKASARPAPCSTAATVALLGAAHPGPEAVLPRGHANGACPLSAPLPLCFAFTPLPQAASPYGALRLRSAPAIRKAQKGTGGEGLRASGLWPERLRGQAEEVCIKPPPRTSGPE